VIKQYLMERPCHQTKVHQIEPLPWSFGGYSAKVRLPGDRDEEASMGFSP
jgi:hypothetical protein